MNAAAMRKRPNPSLLSNLRYLPGQIRQFEKQGRTEDAARSRRMLLETRAELERRGRLPAQGSAVLSYAPDAYAEALAKWTKDIPAGLSS